MRILSGRRFLSGVKIYTVAALIAVSVLSPLALSAVPVVFLLWYLYLWRWKPASVMTLLTEYFTFFFLAVLFAPHIGELFSLLLAVPVLFSIHSSLRMNLESSTCHPADMKHRPTGLCMTLIWLTAGSFVLGLFLDTIAVLLACAVNILFLAVLIGISLWKLTPQSVREIPRNFRIVAGNRQKLTFEVQVSTGYGGILFLESVYDWVNVDTPTVSLETEKAAAEVTIEPMLSGPGSVRLTGYALDCWGLMQIRFEMEPVMLQVIPRAQYAAWLVQEYLSNRKTGSALLVTNIEALKPLYGMRRGIEYYGNQSYQPGDSLKNIDWKHSIQYDELIVKEYAEFHGQPAIVLVNLAAGDAEEADKLAYSIVVTAISLAQENIPAAFTVYTDKEVVVTTNSLQGTALVSRARRIIEEIVTIPDPQRYLTPPDVTRLRSNLGRLRSVGNPAADKLAQLLQIEYQGILNTAAENPATKALREAVLKIGQEANIVIVSHRNHDAEALALGLYNLNRRGNVVMDIVSKNGYLRLQPVKGLPE